LTRALASALTERRSTDGVQHTLHYVPRQRAYAIACSYEDANDAARRRRDPTQKLLCDRDPLSGASLASQPTLSRFENALSERELLRLGAALAERVIERRRRRLYSRVKRITIDLDGTVDPTHGQPRVALWNGHDGGFGYLPLRGTVESDRERVYGHAQYRTRTWPHERCVVIESEVTRYPGRAPRDNPRFVTTNINADPQVVYARVYAHRGDVENRLKELRHGIRIDRPSCSRFLASQARLVRHAAAFVLYQELRLAAAGTDLARAQVTRPYASASSSSAAGTSAASGASPCTSAPTRPGDTNGPTSPRAFRRPCNPPTARQPDHSTNRPNPAPGRAGDQRINTPPSARQPSDNAPAATTPHHHRAIARPRPEPHTTSITTPVPSDQNRPHERSRLGLWVNRER